MKQWNKLVATKEVNNFTFKLVSLTFILVFLFHIVSIPIIFNDTDFFSNLDVSSSKDIIEESFFNSNSDITDKKDLSSEETSALSKKPNEGINQISSPLEKEQSTPIRNIDPKLSIIPSFNESIVSSQIKVNENFTIAQTENLNTSNNYTSFINNDSFSLPNLTGYSNISGSFDVSNVTAIENVENIENNGGTDPTVPRTSINLKDDRRAVGASFNISDERVNITELRFYITSTPSVTAEAFISPMGVNGPTYTTVIGEKITFASVIGWTTLKYNSPVTLTKGTYGVVVNETSTATNLGYNYFIVLDSVNGDQSDYYERGDLTPVNDWSPSTRDLVFQFKYLVLNDTDSSQTKVYSSIPQQVNLTYNGTALTSFTGNNLLLNGTFAEFTSNTSVTLDITYEISYFNSSSPIPIVTNFNINNATLPIWNNTFTHNSAPSGSYTINQRNITIYNIPTDWNATNIYQDSNLYTDAPDSNSTISYTNQTSNLTIHLDQFDSAFSWNVQFTSPNYLNTLDIKQNGISIGAPYQVNSSDTLSVIANLSTTAYNGQNASLLVYDFNSKLNYTEIDFGVISDDIVFTDWIISNSLSPTIHVNGSYQVIIRWLSDDGTQVGYIGVDLEIITQTTLLSPNSIPKTIIHENISLEFDYLSDQNGQTIDNANLTYTTSWGEIDSLIQNGGPGTNYTAEINTSTATEGLRTVTVSALLFGHVNHSITYNVILSRNTTLQTIENASTIYYKDVIEIKILYNNSDTNLSITSGGIEVNNSSVNVSYVVDHYVFVINTSVIDPTLTTFSYVVTTNKLYHENRTDTIVFTMNPNPTIINKDFAPTNDKVTQAFSGGTGDSFTFSLQYNDTIHSTIIPDATLNNNGSLIANITEVEDPTNHSWIITIDPTEANIVQTIMFTFSEDGYQPSLYFLTLNISIAVFNLSFTIDAVQDVLFGTNHTFRLDITDNSSALISGVLLTPNSTAFSIIPVGLGGYDIIYIGATQSYSGSFTFLVQVTKTGFVSNSMLLNYSIIQPLSEFITQVTPMNGSSILSEWGDDTYLNISFIDPTNNIPLQSINELINISDVTVELVSSNNGFHIFRINPQKTGYWVLNLTLDPNLPGYFLASSTFITINASERTTATEFNFINAINGIASPYYERDIVIGIMWNDTEQDTIMAQGDFSTNEIIWNPGGLVWVQFLNYADGVHYFRVYGRSISQFSIQILFNSTEFKAINATLTVDVLLLATNELEVDTTSGFIGSITNQSKFGYTLHLTFNWTISDNGSTIHNPTIEIWNKSTLITPDLFTKYGIFIISNSSDYSAHIFITFYATQNGSNGYAIGWNEFTIKFSFDNYESKEHTLNVYTEGYDLDVTVIYDSKLIPGSTYSITVQMVYSNVSSQIVTNSSTTVRLQLLPPDSLIDSPVTESLPVNYEIEVLLKSNNSVVTIRATRTILDGQSVYNIPADITSDILEIRGISIGIEGATNNAEITFDIDVDDLPIVEENIPGFPLEFLVIAIILTAIIITITLFTIGKNRSRKRRKEMVVSRQLADTKERIALISNIYTILITSESGLPVYSIINSLYKNNPAISEIVSGLSVGIDSFLQSFQTDFMQQLGEAITDQKQVKLSIIQREEFQIMILGTLSYRAFVFLREKPPQFVMDIFTNIIADLQTSVKLDDLIDEKTIRPKAEYVVRKFFPLTLLSTFVIDPNRLKFVEAEIKKSKDPKISQEALLALKQLALVRSGLMTNFKTSPQERGKLFDKLLKKGELGEIGIIHYDVAYNMLNRTLDLPIEIVLEALWTGSSQEVSIIIPFHEELIPRSY